jgi:hypothetical protein
VPVIERQSNTIESKTLEKLGVFLLEEVLQELGYPMRSGNNHETKTSSPCRRKTLP